MLALAGTGYGSIGISTRNPTRRDDHLLAPRVLGCLGESEAVFISTPTPKQVINRMPSACTFECVL